MVKLSKQLQQKKEDQQTRPTRTQRVAQEQAIKRYNLEKQRFELLKEQAKKIQEEKFKDKVVTETYQEKIPKKYNVNDYTRREWYRKPSYVRERWMQNAERNRYRGDWAIDILTKTRQKTIKFTINEGENSYKSIYENLSPDLKQFFDPPDVVLQQKTERIDETKQTIKEKLNYADERIRKARERYERKRESYDRRREQLRNNNYSPERYRRKVRSLKDNLDDAEDRMEEDIHYWQGYKKGLGKGLRELNAGKEISYKSVLNYADDVGNYERRKKEARNEQRKFDYQQRRKIKDLEQQGYKPFIIEKSFKGNPEKVELDYYNAKTGDWKTITEFKTKGKVNVAGLKRVSFSEPQTRTIKFAGREFKFKSKIPIFKSKTGEFVTPYKKTGITETQLIQQARDKQFKEWKDQNKNNFNIKYKVIKGKNLPFGYGGQQTISTEPKNVLISEDQYYNIQNKKSFDFGVGKLWGGVKSAYKWVDNRVHWDLSASPSMPKLTLSFGLKEKPTIPEIAINKGIEGIKGSSEDIEKWVIGEDKINAFKSDLENKYSEQYQREFENKYMEDLIYNRTSFEKASKEFKESKEAKILQKKYEEEYKTGYKELQTDVGFWKGRVAGGVAQVGLGLGELGLKTIKSPTRSVVTAGGVYAGVGVLKSIPSVVSLTATGGLFAYGTYKFVSPKSTYIEAGSGLVTAVLSGATLGYAGYKYLKSPVVKTVKIKPPKASLKSTETIGKDIKILTDKGSANIIKFENQKLSQTASAGRRTIVTTKGREIARRFWEHIGVDKKFAENYIYKGVPTEQLGRVYKVETLRGSYIYREPSAYQKALKLLKKYGWTENQARATLRYYAPRVTEQYLDQGMIAIKGNKAIGEFEYLTKRPVLDVDKSLGIKTRGGSTIKDVYSVERKLIDIKGKSVVAEQKTQLSLVLDKSGKIKDLKDFSFSRGLNIGKSTELRKGFEVLKDGKLTVYKEAQYRDLYGISFNRKILPSDNILRIDTSQTKLINKIIDLRGETGKKYFGGKKTSLSKTFGSDKDLVVNVMGKSKKVTGSTNVNKIIDEINDLTPKTASYQSKYYGKGLYERTDFVGGISPTQNAQLQQQLKTVALPDQVKVMDIKKLIKIKNMGLTDLKVGQLSSLAVASGIKTDLKLKVDLKSNTKLKSLLKEDIGLKSNIKQQTALKTDTVLRSQLKSLLDLSTPVPALQTTPTFKPPRIPTFKPPIPKPFVIPFLKGEISKRSIRKSKKKNEFAYLPDFTSRALGLEAETITEKQAKRKLKKLLTGLEIRRGVKLK